MNIPKVSIFFLLLYLPFYGFSIDCFGEKGIYKLDSVVNVFNDNENEVKFYVFQTEDDIPHCGIVEHMKNGKIILSDTIDFPYPSLSLVDYNFDGVKDLVIQKSSSARSVPTYYIYLIDLKVKNLKRILEFEDINDPTPRKEDSVIVGLSLYGDIQDYSFHKFNNKSELVNLGYRKISYGGQDREVTVGVEKSIHDSIFISNSVLIVKDSSNYSSEYLNEFKMFLKNSEYSKSYPNTTFLLDSNQITQKGIPASFEIATFPELNRSFLLTARKDNFALVLSGTRINYSTLKYKLVIVQFGRKSYFLEGFAHVRAKIPIVVDRDFNEFTEQSYLIDEYFDNTDSCQLSIRIGSEESIKNVLFAKISSNCNEKIKNIDLENFPTLIEK